MTLIGQKVKVNVGNDNWGEVIDTSVPYLVTKEIGNEYGISPIFHDVEDKELLGKGYYRLTVGKESVEIWR